MKRNQQQAKCFASFFIDYYNETFKIWAFVFNGLYRIQLTINVIEQ